MISFYILLTVQIIFACATIIFALKGKETTALICFCGVALIYYAIMLLSVIES